MKNHTEEEPYLSHVIGPNKYVTMSRSQYDAIAEIVDRDDRMTAEIDDYHRRWVEVNEGDDPIAFAELPECIGEIMKIVRIQLASEEAMVLAGAFLMKYRNQRAGEK